jgi:hypothetical protein
LSGVVHFDADRIFKDVMDPPESVLLGTGLLRSLYFWFFYSLLSARSINEFIIVKIATRSWRTYFMAILHSPSTFLLLEIGAEKGSTTNLKSRFRLELFDFAIERSAKYFHVRVHSMKVGRVMQQLSFVSCRWGE